MDDPRAALARIVEEHLARDDALGWFEALYASADGDPSRVPWADLAPNPMLAEWLDEVQPPSGRALVVGCGLGDDAEHLAGEGFDVVAFDLSETAVTWCRQRFPGSSVAYEVADLLDPQDGWRGAFDLVVEIYTLQSLTAAVRPAAARVLPTFVAPGGRLLVICRGADVPADAGPPWALTRADLAPLAESLTQVAFDDLPSAGEPPVRRFRVTYAA